ncbi:YggS family pyridoxal phosphate-dependent enzyme [Pelagibacterium xiamenense]|uniref:YggS family pyridoxal phosphate-dependent enzyme n=1 Tax=Pelagibacterium xiamenense TaxID=2901140 RepID=UPI001E58B1ED|nr:YggS family pyridoxal phosphate-dependent enzyme [Pelagibacterium xiamenense]MCD7058416.1 YggS family pyridoxal phosphate-dependent enzyme [Pelagibacterium xiamenense]
MTAPAPSQTPAAQRLEDIVLRMEKAARRIEGLAVPKLIAVSKTFGTDAIEPLLAAGQRDFGENRVQEAQRKWPALKAAYPDARLHLIGPLQTNKARDAVALFDVIHSLDREKLAKILANEMAAQGRKLPCFVQVNIGGEEQKAGVAVSETVQFVGRCREAYGLEIAGLMCIPPVEEAPGPYFAQLAQLAADAGVSGLSMGMSADFETAILMGASHVRVGSALFGARDGH